MIVPDWREAWRWSSVRLHAAVLGLVALYEIMPSLNPQIAALLPTHWRPWGYGIYAIIGLLLRLTKVGR